jgi:hypothetical protein
MALTFRGQSTCQLCGGVLAESDDLVAFPAFLPAAHELFAFSDAALHRKCFEQDPRAARIEALYAKYRTIWDARPKDLKTVEEMDAWVADAFKHFP